MEQTRSVIWRKHLHPGWKTEWDAVDAILKDLESTEVGLRYWRDRAGTVEAAARQKVKKETWVCVDCAQENHGLMLTYDTKLYGQKCSECHRNIVPCMSITVSKKKR